MLGTVIQNLPVNRNGLPRPAGPMETDRGVEAGLDLRVRHAGVGAESAASTAETISGAWGSVRGPKAAIS